MGTRAGDGDRRSCDPFVQKLSPRVGAGFSRPRKRRLKPAPTREDGRRLRERMAGAHARLAGAHIGAIDARRVPPVSSVARIQVTEGTVKKLGVIALGIICFVLGVVVQRVYDVSGVV